MRTGLRPVLIRNLLAVDTAAFPERDRRGRIYSTRHEKSARPSPQPFVASLPRRKSVRLPDYDYTRPGAYFVTICTQDKQPLLGEILNGEVHYTELGILVQTCWLSTPRHFPNATVDAFVVMPNHVHGVLLLTDMRVEYIRPLHVVIAAFKAAVTRRAGTAIWQRNYYEHILRNEDELNLARHYIQDNPSRWPRP